MACEVRGYAAFGGTERMMVRWMCDASLESRTSSVELNKRLGVKRVTDVVRRGRLRWLGIWSVKVATIGCPHADTLKWRV